MQMFVCVYINSRRIIFLLYDDEWKKNYTSLLCPNSLQVAINFQLLLQYLLLCYQLYY